MYVYMYVMKFYQLQFVSAHDLLNLIFNRQTATSLSHFSWIQKAESMLVEQLCCNQTKMCNSHRKMTI